MKLLGRTTYAEEYHSPTDYNEWVKERQQLTSSGAIGGSDIPALLGIYSSPYELMQKMKGEIPPFEGNTKTEIGRILEPLVAERTSRMIGIEVTPCQRIYKSISHPFMIANMDYLGGEPKLELSLRDGFECKTTSSFYMMKELGPNGSDQCPLSYIVQCQHYMAVTGISSFYIGVLCLLDQSYLEELLSDLKAGYSPEKAVDDLSHYYRWYHINRNEAFIDRLKELESDFHEAFSKDQPPIDGSDATSMLLKDKYVNRTDDYKEPDTYDKSLLKEYWDLHEEVKSKENRINQIKNIWRAKAKDFSGINGVVNFSTTHKEKFDQKRFKSEQPDLYSEYMDQSSFERMIISKLK